MDEKPLPCFKCSKDLEGVFLAHSQPWDAVTFTSEGQYGSRVFDPGDRTMLTINICDDCLRRQPQLVRHESYRRIINRLWSKPWTPPSEEEGDT